MILRRLISLALMWPATGFFMRPVRRAWRIAIGVAFVIGPCLWYYSAMISIALLS